MEAGKGELSLLFMLSAGHIDSLHQSPASQQASDEVEGEALLVDRGRGVKG